MSTINDFDAPETPADTGHEGEPTVSLPQSDVDQPEPTHGDAAEPTLVMSNSASYPNADEDPAMVDSAIPAAGTPAKQPLVPGIWSWRRLPDASDT